MRVSINYVSNRLANNEELSILNLYSDEDMSKFSEKIKINLWVTYIGSIFGLIAGIYNLINFFWGLISWVYRIKALHKEHGFTKPLKKSWNTVATIRNLIKRDETQDTTEIVMEDLANNS